MGVDSSGSQDGHTRPEKQECKPRTAAHAQSLSCAQLFTTPWTVACQAPLFLGLSVVPEHMREIIAILKKCPKTW